MVLDQPTRDGDTEIHLLTNLPAKDARAKVIAELYRKRWTIETAFEELEATLNGEINTLGYPKAALFAFCVALVSYNVLSTVKAALRSVHGAKVVGGGVGLLPGRRGRDDAPGDDDRDPGGRMGGVPRPDPGGVGRGPAGVGRAVRLSEYRKQPRGPKKPKPKRRIVGQQNHVSTAKLLKARESST